MREAYLCYIDAKRADFIEVLCDINNLIFEILEADATMRKEKASLPKQMLGIAKPKVQPLLLATTYDCPGTDVGARLDRRGGSCIQLGGFWDFAFYLGLAGRACIIRILDPKIGVQHRAP